MFGITDGKGFHMTFENGLTISVQFGYMNYCSNRDTNKLFKLTSKHTIRHDHDIQSENAEIMIWDKDNNTLTDLFTKDGESDGTVAGWISVDRLADIIHEVKNYGK